MKLVTYILKNSNQPEQRIGVLTIDEKQIVDLQSASKSINGKEEKHFQDMIAFLEGGAEARKMAESLLASASDECKVNTEAVQLLAPIPRPRTFRDTLCYEEHVVNGIKVAAKFTGKDITTMDPELFKPNPDWYQKIVYYKVNTNSIIGTGVDIAYPEGEALKDYELELAVIIGKEGKNINAKNAMDYVGGYTIMNDCSARMTQVTENIKGLEMGPMISKDFANVLGPCMVTPDSFNPNDAATVVRVNGEVRARNNVGTAYHKIPDVLEHMSTNTTLYPGDVIAMGTVGCGSGIEIGKVLYIDDVIELEIEGIGKISNKVVSPGTRKKMNRFNAYKRYVCAKANGKSDFVIDDYPDVTGTKYADLWKITEMPAKQSATAEVDMGNLSWDHEAARNGSTFRYVEINPFVKSFKGLDSLPPEKAEELYKIVIDMHKSIGTHYLPTREDMKKSAIMHKTNSVNLFICLQSGAVAVNDEDEIHLQAGDALVQLGSMHGWSLDGDGSAVIGGLLVDADLSTGTKLTSLPQLVMKSTLNKFKRYVSGTKFSENKMMGLSGIIINDYSPNETELFDEKNKCIGYVGEIWKTFGQKADMSGNADTITGAVEAKPPKNGINFRMIELLPNCEFKTDKSLVNYYTIIGGEIEAISESKKVSVKDTESIIQLKANLTLKNNSDKPVRMVNFMIDAVN